MALLRVGALGFVLLADAVPPPPVYAWLTRPPAPEANLARRFAPPTGCQRVAVATGSWGAWLCTLPLRPAGTLARLYNGQLKGNQAVVAAVVNLAPRTTDLQQCADAIIRLRAEYLFSINPNKIHFHLTTSHNTWFSA